MPLWFALLMSHFCLKGAAADSTALERIEDCHTSCSQGLNCRTKSDSWLHPACQDPAEGLNSTSVFHNINISTVMQCEQKQKCALHLRIATSLQLAESIHGVSICTNSAGMLPKCRNLHFTKASRKKMSGHLVTVRNDCTEVSPNQRMEIAVRTIPSYCGITWAGSYHTPGCIDKDLRGNVPECITGRLLYVVNLDKKELKINVSDMLEGYDYHLRLCHKDFICAGTGANTLIKREQPIKSAVLSFSRPLPCLCIEGWSAVMDAPRVQVCPFKDRVEELWSGISFDPEEEMLLWTPACSVTAVAGLCEKSEEGVCVDLPHSSQNVSRGKITFAKVDPHPNLCLRFTSGSQSWIRCPFADGIKVWNVVATRQTGHQELKIFSQITAKFSVGWCIKSAGSPVCKTNETHIVHVDKRRAVNLKLEGELCNSCLQVKRLDVKYAAAVVHCFGQCEAALLTQTTWDLTWVVLPAAVCLSGVIILTLVLHIMLNVHQRRKQKSEVSAKQKGPAFDSVVAALHTQPVFVHDLKQCESQEKANLIS